MVLFIVLYKLVQTFIFRWNPSGAIKMEVTEQYFQEVLFAILDTF